MLALNNLNKGLICLKENALMPAIKCPKILIVDDDTFNLMSLEMILKKLNYSCLKAYNGEEACKIFKEKMIKNKC